MTWLYDAHIHLSDPEYDADMDFILKSMEKMRIKACCVSSNYEDSLKTLELAHKSELVLPFIGIHPENALEPLDKIQNLIENQKDRIAGIGEIGLDPTYLDNNNGNNNDNNDDGLRKQNHTFEALLSLAEKYDKPVSIHSRKSLEPVLETLSSFNLKKVLLHWFDGNKRQLDNIMDRNYFVSYGPVMVYANDKQSLLAKTAIDKVLVETDGPVRFSRCFGFKTAQVSFIPSVVFCASKVLQHDYEELCSIIENNMQRYLGII